MTTDQFNQKFTLDRSAKTPRATEKHVAVEYPLALTADGKPFSHGAEYFYFDGEKVRSTEGLRRIDAENLGSLGSRIIAISKLRQSRDVAIEDAQ